MLEHKELVELKSQLQSVFSLETMKSVVWRAGVDPENIGGNSTLTSFVRETVSHFSRHETIDRLMEACGYYAPTIDWSRWGGKLPSEDIQTALRSLLDSAFSISEIRTIAFDIDMRIYDDVVASQSKSKSIEIVIQAVIYQNKIIELMNLVRSKNPYAYNKYFDRINQALLRHQNSQKQEKKLVTAKEPFNKVRFLENHLIVLDVLNYYAEGNWDGGEKASGIMSKLKE